MKIKYRITLVFTTIVTIILLFLCVGIYLFSAKNLEEQFKTRLYRKALSTAAMLKSSEVTPDFLKELNRTSPSALIDKSIVTYDLLYSETFTYNDSPNDTLVVTQDIIDKTKDKGIYYYKYGRREVVSMEYKENNAHYIIAVAALDADREEWLSKLRLILSFSFLFSVSGVVIVGYLFSMGLVRPINKLTNKINQISSKDLSLRLDAGSGKNELQQLARTINNLLERLQLSFETQRRFINNASHELLTPLASIGSQLDVALQRERTGEEYNKVMTSVAEDVKNLISLVRSLLEIAKVSGSPSGIELTSVRVDELLLQLPSEMKKINPNFNVKLNFDELPENYEQLTVFGNEPLLLCAIRNVVHNACKYSNDKTANVKLLYTDSGIKVYVEDNGPGISDHDIKNIFQPFFRGEETNYKIPGSGLGLPLAEHIIRMYNGTIEVHSTPRVGSTFIISLKPE
jgi:signal transduction histidine kinase